jgi:peptide/nickel transport system substrate-binding protein
MAAHPLVHEDLALSRRGLLAATAAGGVALALPASAARAASGGKLRVGIVGGGSKETLDPHQVVTEIDIARARCLFENLTDYAPNGAIVNRLASGFSSNKAATVWKVKLRRGVKFHDGSALTADDVVFSLRRITSPKNKLQGAGDLPFLKPGAIRELDASTVELRLTQPIADLRTPLAARAIQIIKNGTTSFDKPNGTGPFTLVSFQRGQRSTLAPFKGYRTHGGPKLDELTLISIDDSSARANALIGGQVDAIVNLDAKLVPTVSGNSKLRVLQSKTGGYTPQTMLVTAPPFTDVRVRQAFRLMIDRKQIVQNALGGFGTVGNDLACPYDQDFAHLPPREHDPEKAKALLKAAGQEGVTVSLYTSDAAAGMLESSTLIAEQAKQAGVTITLDRVPADSYYSDKYLKAAFGCSQWSQKPLDTQILQALDSKAPYNETGWRNAAFDKLTRTARRTLNPARRKELYVEAQRMLYDEGGYIIWGFPNLIDAASSRVHGLKSSSARSLGYYDFLDVTVS